MPPPGLIRLPSSSTSPASTTTASSPFRLPSSSPCPAPPSTSGSFSPTPPLLGATTPPARRTISESSSGVCGCCGDRVPTLHWVLLDPPGRTGGSQDPTSCIILPMPRGDGYPQLPRNAGTEENDPQRNCLTCTPCTVSMTLRSVEVAAANDFRHFHGGDSDARKGHRARSPDRRARTASRRAPAIDREAGPSLLLRL